MCAMYTVLRLGDQNDSCPIGIIQCIVLAKTTEHECLHHNILPIARRLGKNCRTAEKDCEGGARCDDWTEENEDKETWWWNESVQECVKKKREAKNWDRLQNEASKKWYKEMREATKREVARAKEHAYEELYDKLETEAGQKKLYKLAKQRERAGKDVQLVKVIKDQNGVLLSSEEDVRQRWENCFEKLMNEKNERERRENGGETVSSHVRRTTKDEVKAAMKRMKHGKAVGPDDIPIEAWKALGDIGVNFLTKLFNQILETEEMPEEWRKSILVPIYKNKGHIQNCSNYRGIKLMSYSMKLWERVIEVRLRDIVPICAQQFGFMPRKNYYGCNICTQSVDGEV